MTCFALEVAFGPLTWRCNRPAGHDGPHGYDHNKDTHHEWVDE